MDNDLKDILLEVLDALEDSRANQVSLAALLGHGTSLAAASDAKDQAMKESKKHFAPLRGKIEAL